MNRALLLGLLTVCGTAAVVDRIAVVVGKTVITESEVLAELRVTAFLNKEPLQLGPQQRREAAERLVDQQLIRNEMRIGNYPQPPAADADAMYRKVCEENYGGEAGCRTTLAKYGLTGEQLKEHLLWQIAALRFTDQRFSAGLPAPVDASSDGTAPGTTSGANRSAPGADSTATSSVDQQMDAWLKEARNQTRVQFKKEAFQ